MNARHLALIATLALATPAFTTTAEAAGPQRRNPPASQGRGHLDRDRDPRERALFARYTGRDSAWQFAFKDGYSAGLRAGRDRRRFDPTSDSRFRSGDRGYSRGWGSRTQYVSRYRDAFRDGYERGYYDAVNQRGSFSLFFRWGGR